MIDLEIVEKLLELLSQSDADKIEIRDGDESIKVSRNSGGAVAYQVASPALSAPPALSAAAETHSGGAVEASGGSADNLTEIASPMVGTFYAQSEPGADPYVRVGDRISIGQTLCIIEAMKIMNTLDAEVTGVLKEINVTDATPVEFGQVLFRVDPNG